MSTIKKEIRKNTIMQIAAGFLLYVLMRPQPVKTPVLSVGPVTPVAPDYVSTYFKDSEYFGKNVIPVDYYGNWLLMAEQLDKIREAWGTPVLIKKGYTIKEEKYAACRAVEIYPQNNNHTRFAEIVQFINGELLVNKIQKLSNNNIYIEI